MKVMVLLQVLLFSMSAFAQEAVDIGARGAEQRREIEVGGITRVELESRDGFFASLHGTPAEFLGLEVLNEQQLEEALIPAIYRYYGFTGAESLSFAGKETSTQELDYLFQEYINGINTRGYLIVEVDPSSKRITNICCALQIDRDYDTEPAISEQDAVDRVMNHLEASGYVATYQPGADWKASFRAELIYVRSPQGKALQPGWLVEVPVLDDSASGEAYGEFTVMPGGGVRRPRTWNGITVDP
jgi:hypothetical protein